ncbi:GNAT family N-acetyltransferase [Micromonospora ureilytica]|uniref:GNAT family N-acetyltransferase n=1 Tax=Micromonospora ureilytica TaxID=709868 RepID=UPI0040394985
MVVGHGFERLGLHRISLAVFAFNPRARRCTRRLASLPRVCCGRSCATATTGLTPL